MTEKNSDKRTDLKIWSVRPLPDDRIFYDMITYERKVGKIHYREEFVRECAEKMAFYLLKHPEEIRGDEEDDREQEWK